MHRKDYKNYVWYQVTDDTFWVNDNKDFPNCETIVYWKFEGENHLIYTKSQAWMGWGTMARQGDWYFMIIEKF